MNICYFIIIFIYDASTSSGSTNSKSLPVDERCELSDSLSDVEFEL